MEKRLALLISLAVLLAFWTPSYGAHFAQVGGGFSAEAGAYASDSQGSGEPNIASDYDPEYVWLRLDSVTDLTYANGEAYGEAGFCDASYPPIEVHLGGCPYIYTGDLYPNSWAYGNCELAAPSVTNGIFFFIEPGAGESIGDEIFVHYTCELSADIAGQSWCTFGGPGSMDHMAITLNESPPVTGSPNPAKEVWTRDEFQVTSGYFDIDDGAFEARIGDVVGVFVSVRARSALTSGEYGWADGYAWLKLWANDRCPADFNDDRVVNFKDIAVLADYWLWENIP